MPGSACAAGSRDRAVVLRRVVAGKGTARVEVVLDLRGRFGTSRYAACAATRLASGAARLGDVHMSWTGAGEAAAAPDGHRWPSSSSLTSSSRRATSHDFVLVLAADADVEPPPTPTRPGRATEAAWRERVPSSEYSGRAARCPPRLRRAAGLTSGGGGMVAAATMSLPERARQGRNYDYRYVWIRDQCYAGQAVAKAGPHPLLDDAVRFVADRLLEDGPELKPAYTTTGGPVPDERRLDLPGYPGGADIVGNWVNEQFQLDAFGEALLLFAAAADHDHLDADGWRAAEVAVARDRAALARARRRDLGARARRLDAQPADLRRRAARDRRPRAGRARGTLARPGRRDRRRYRRARSTHPGAGSARPTTTDSTPPCSCPRSAAPSRATTRARSQPCEAVDES